MLCLGIESSCDDTGLALVEDGKLVNSVLSSQADIHNLFGGVVPELASREHYRHVGPLLDELLKKAKLDIHKIDYICAARGPGLLGSLLVGVAFAKALALSLERPFLGVNHLHAHILVAGLENRLPFPFLGLLASGGHTYLYNVHAPDNFEILGKCLDDAAGEAFDKIGKLLGLPYPAGGVLDKLSGGGDCAHVGLPRPYLDNNNLDFSFSGLKTHAAQYLERENGVRWFESRDKNPEAEKNLKNFCASFNEAIAETLAVKAKRALGRENNFRAVVLAGGVAANSLLRQKMRIVAENRGLPLICPRPNLCTDNGVMIAYAGWLLARNGFQHALDMESIPRGRTIPNDMLGPSRQAKTAAGAGMA